MGLEVRMKDCALDDDGVANVGFKGGKIELEKGWMLDCDFPKAIAGVTCLEMGRMSFGFAEVITGVDCLDIVVGRITCVAEEKFGVDFEGGSIA